MLLQLDKQTTFVASMVRPCDPRTVDRSHVVIDLISVISHALAGIDLSCPSPSLAPSTLFIFIRTRFSVLRCWLGGLRHGTRATVCCPWVVASSPATARARNQYCVTALDATTLPVKVLLRTTAGTDSSMLQDNHHFGGRRSTSPTWKRRGSSVRHS